MSPQRRTIQFICESHNLIRLKGKITNMNSESVIGDSEAVIYLLYYVYKVYISTLKKKGN